MTGYRMVQGSTMCRLAAIACGTLLAVGCSDRIRAVDGPGAELRNFTSAHTRIVWAQGDGTDPAAEGTQLILMGFDSDDGKGERTVLGDRRSYHKPKLTSRADRIVFSSFMIPGPSETFIVNWDGTGLRKLADGFALTLWQNPVDGQGLGLYRDRRRQVQLQNGLAISTGYAGET